MLNKLLLFSAGITLMSAASAHGVNIYSSDIPCELNGVSPNGKYAVAADGDNHFAYLWCIDNPLEWIDITPDNSDEDLPAAMIQLGAEVYSVSNSGMAVGCVYYGDHTAHPAYYLNGEWIDLPMHPASRASNSAVAVTADGSVISGYMFITDPTGGIPGHFYPCRWVRDEEGDYDLTAYTDIELPNHQGFYPTSMNPEGTIIAGMVYCGVDSTVPAMITAEGELTIFAKIEEKLEPLIYKGKYETRDENGKQGWTDDPNDPNIVLYPNTYIDGVRDDNTHPFVGRFNHFDWSGHIYASRTVASDVNEETGEGKLSDIASYYDVTTGQWHDNAEFKAYSTGLQAKILFPGDQHIVIDGRVTTLSAEFGIKSNRMIAAVNTTSRDGQVLGIMTAQLNDATGEYDYFPLIAVLDEPLVEDHGGVQMIENQSAAEVTTTPGQIIVTNAIQVAVFDLQGRKLSSAAQTSVVPGLYIIVADGCSYKLMVK